MTFQVRNWFAENGLKNLPSGSNIWYEYHDFYKILSNYKRNLGFNQFEINNLPINEFMFYIDNYI